MLGYTYGNIVQPTGDQIGYYWFFFDKQSKGAGPKLVRESLEFLLDGFRVATDLFNAACMDNQRIKAGPVFCLKDLSYRIDVQGVTGEAVNGFDGQCYQFPRFQEFFGPGNIIS